MGLRDNERERRYELEVDGQIVWADYRRDGERLVITHVEAPVALRGTGAAGRLMGEVTAEARAGKLRIVPLCGYAAAWLRRNPDQADLVVEA